MGKKVEWGNLPEELWPAIGKRLRTSIDVLRFRSICKSWRSSVTPSYTLPARTLPRITTPFGKFRLAHATIYRLELSDVTQSENPSISNRKGWLIKVKEPKFGGLHVLNPLTNTHKRYPSHTCLNLMNFRVIELFNAHSLKYVDGVWRDIQKVVVFPKFTGTDVGNCMVCAIYHEGKLGFSKIDDQKWTLVDDKNFYYDDVIVYKGQFYVTDRWGTISWLDISSLKLIQYSPPLCGFGNKKHLVECGGSLFVVDMYMEAEAEQNSRLGRLIYNVADVKVYKLDEEWGTWVHIKDLGEHLFVLGEDCNFSLSAQDFYGCEGNCIYFNHRGAAQVFVLENSKVKTPKVFWPCPNLFDPEFSLSK